MVQAPVSLTKRVMVTNGVQGIVVAKRLLLVLLLQAYVGVRAVSTLLDQQ